jgi:hypothetical protein
VADDGRKARVTKLKDENVGRLVEKMAVFLREFDASQVKLAAYECTPPNPFRYILG